MRGFKSPKSIYYLCVHFFCRVPRNKNIKNWDTGAGEGEKTMSFWWYKT